MMEQLTGEKTYISPENKPFWLGRIAPAPVFYYKMMRVILRGAREGKRGEFNNERWYVASIGMLRGLESVGVRVYIENMDIPRNLNTSCVFIGNHMSVLETFVLPCVLLPFQDITFVIKQSLIEYPVFKHIMINCDPIIVTRTNPREDFKIVMEGGEERLKRGVSIVVFPQTTRTITFIPEQFNTIGVKLARKANVPVIPIALKTDAWGNGKIVKDFGKIQPKKAVRFAFGDPIHIQDNGREAHEKIIAFIEKKLKSWS